MTTTVLATDSKVPSFDHDFWSDEVIMDPYPYYRMLRDAGAAVWMTQHNVWAITRHTELRDALLNAEVFSSARGVTMNEPMNRASEGIMLCSDDPQHREMRKIFARPLMPAALASLKEHLRELADARVAELMRRDTFDAVADLGRYLPLTVITELVGLSPEGKDKMLAWAAGIFNAMGPDGNARTLSGMEITKEAFGYLHGVDPASLAPDGWGAALFSAAEQGQVAYDAARNMLMDYLGPSLDTTINATSSAIWLFANNLDQWTKLGQTPELIPHAIEEVVRMESPIRAFSRYVTRDYEVGGVTLPAGSRVLVLYACANRDERKFPDPDRFDVARKPREHIGFGYGTHVCAGMHLARMEIASVLESLVQHVTSFEILEEHREPHNTLRGLQRLIVRAHRS